jgi:hypothetical protein
MAEPPIFDYFFSGQQYIRVRRSETGPGQTDPGYPAPISNWGWPSGFGKNGIDAALYSGGPLVNPGSSGLNSNWNYVLSNSGKNITGLSVKINIDNDLASPVTDQGFNFQVNCESPASPSGSGIPTWQQFMFDNHANDVNIFGWINLWELNSTGWTETYASGTNGSFVLPAANTIKAGSVLTIAPVFNANDEITSCNFSYTDPTGKTLSKSAPVSAPKLAPIVSVTVHIVGWGDGANATASSGQGTITYSALNPLTAQASWAETAETSNIVYEPLPPAVNVSQLFGVAPTGFKAPAIGKRPQDKPLPPGTHPIVPSEK